jgi:hypothetical protein
VFCNYTHLGWLSTIPAGGVTVLLQQYRSISAVYSRAEQRSSRIEQSI